MSSNIKRNPGIKVLLLIDCVQGIIHQGPLISSGSSWWIPLEIGPSPEGKFHFNDFFNAPPPLPLRLTSLGEGGRSLFI